ncbi:MAG: hypothetical protein Hyperionvirus2_212 [Hyperionvirus sp.]|uniref:BTB domain-containing protein n=1 Tax=Hyperionvirus sp. TaxID=2487770 RepID=A0A3G5A8L9_9VIRU|nr:MAG: hypothetical protein Hyperionvirus2_212 [Hyperionvirus sp.]
MEPRPEFAFQKHDVVFLVDGIELPFYKAILFEHSDVFKKMFSNKMVECKENKVEVENFSSFDIETFLRVIHPLIPQKVNFTNVFKIFEVAHMYQCAIVLEQCFKCIQNYYFEGMALNYFIDGLQNSYLLAEKFSDDSKIAELFKGAVSNIIKNFSKDNSDKYNFSSLAVLPGCILALIIEGVYKEKNLRVALEKSIPKPKVTPRLIRKVVVAKPKAEAVVE